MKNIIAYSMEKLYKDLEEAGISLLNFLSMHFYK